MASIYPLIVLNCYPQRYLTLTATLDRTSIGRWSFLTATELRVLFQTPIPSPCFAVYRPIDNLSMACRLTAVAACCSHISTALESWVLFLLSLLFGLFCVLSVECAGNCEFMSVLNRANFGSKPFQYRFSSTTVALHFASLNTLLFIFAALWN